MKDKSHSFFFWLSIALLGLPSAYAGETDNQNQTKEMNFNLSGEQWVKTQDADLFISINAALNQEGYAALRQKIQADLKTIAPGEWHLVQFNRLQDASGLDRVIIEAELRVTEDTLGHLSQTLKKLSHPGVQFNLSRLDYTPSLKDLENAKNTLRQSLYQSALQELALYNKLNPSSPYILASISYMDESNNNPQPMPMMAMKREGASANVSANNTALGVSQKVRYSAQILFRGLVKNA